MEHAISVISMCSGMICSPSRKCQCSAMHLWHAVAFWSLHEVEKVMSVWLNRAKSIWRAGKYMRASQFEEVSLGCLWWKLLICEWHTKVCRAFQSLTLKLLVAQIIKGWHSVLGKHHCFLPLIWWFSVTNTGKTLARWIFSPSFCGCSCSSVDRHVYVCRWARILSKTHKSRKQQHKMSCSVWE